MLESMQKTKLLLMQGEQRLKLGNSPITSNQTLTIFNKVLHMDPDQPRKILLILTQFNKAPQMVQVPKCNTTNHMIQLRKHQEAIVSQLLEWSLKDGVEAS